MENLSSDQTIEADEFRWGGLGDWIQLIRFPNVFTLLSNCIAAGIISVGALGRLSAVIPLFVASVLAYWAGLILNDVNDIDEDRKHRPDRPLAAGKISPVVAGQVANGMLMLVPLIVALVCYQGYWEWLVGALASSISLVVSIKLYNSLLKHTPLGPLLMGACRSLNILMIGFGLLSVYWGKEFSMVARFPNTLIAYAVAVGIYICGLTIYARREEQASNQATLVLGTILELAGLIVMALLPMWSTYLLSDFNWRLPPNSAYPVLIGLIGVTILNRAFSGVLHPVPRKVQLAVKQAILSLIMIDAAVVLMFAGTWYGVAVVMLLMPAVIGAMRVRTT